MEGFSFIRDTHYRHLKTKSILTKYFGKFVGKKAQWRISKKKNLKTDLTRKQSTPNFPKSKHCLTPETQT